MGTMEEEAFAHEVQASNNEDIANLIKIPPPVDVRIIGDAFHDFIVSIHVDGSWAQLGIVPKTFNPEIGATDMPGQAWGDLKKESIAALQDALNKALAVL